jgi:hypothetical protein
MSFSLKSQLSYSGLSAAVEGAATSAYGRIRSYMEEMMGVPVVLTIFLMVLVRSTPDGKTPDRSFNTRFNHDGLGASEEAAAIDNYHRLRAFMEDALSDLAADVSIDLTMTVRPTLELPPMIVSEVSEVMESDVHDGLVEAEASSSQTEGLYMALTEEQYKEKFGADRPPPIVPDQPKVCGAAGCIDCPPAAPEPKINYNHPNWPSPMTKRFAKHLATHSRENTKTIRTHQDALEYIAKRAKVSVETLLTYPIKHYQSAFEPWTLVHGSSKYFPVGTWCLGTWWY